MKATWIALLTVLLIAGGVLMSLPSGASAKDHGFHTSWDAARKAARKEGKPLYVHFTTTWCGWCRKIEDEVYAHKEGREALKAFIARAPNRIAI